VKRWAINVRVSRVALHTIMGQILTSFWWGPGPSVPPPVGCSTEAKDHFQAQGKGQGLEPQSQGLTSLSLTGVFWKFSGGKQDGSSCWIEVKVRMFCLYVCGL